jgi:acetyl esterase/lipase
MAYFVSVLSIWLVIAAATALRPGRRGLFAVLAFPVGWTAGELGAQAIALEAGLVGLLWWWGWPRDFWLNVVVLVLVSIVVLENLAIVAISFYSRRVVRRALEASPRRPLELPRPRDDRFGSWWRTALQLSFHPRDLAVTRNVVYGPEPRHRLDVWRSAHASAHAPVMFYVHGGAWSYGDKREQGRPMLHEFAARGWVVVACNYRLAPQHPWPAQIEDVTRTLGWIKQHIVDFGGDPSRVVVSGGSAGGHLAALVALSAHDATWRPAEMTDVTDWSVRACISFYGVLEMTGDETHWHGRGEGLRALLAARVVQTPYEGNEDLYRSFSPLHRISVDAPPFLVVQGGNDTLVDVHVARGFIDTFRRRAVAPAYHVELPFTQHAYDVTASPRTSATTRAAVVFAETYAAPRPSLDPSLVAHYQSPPTLVEVESADGLRHSARDVARERGSFFVVAADNPYSRRSSLDENVARRRELEMVVVDHGHELWRTVARDPSGQWPDEAGVAIFGAHIDVARALAEAFEQFAFFEVTPEHTLVRATLGGAVLV